jgi:hypothetical protein
MKIVFSKHWEDVLQDEFWKFDEKLSPENLLRACLYYFRNG